MSESLRPDPGSSTAGEVEVEAPPPALGNSPEPETYRVGIVDLDKSVESVARDVADEKMTAEKKELRGVKGFVSKIWRHNLFQAYYRNKEVAQARQKIISNKDLLANDGASRAEHEKEMGAIVDRFTSEYEELVHTEAGEQKEALENDEYGQQIKDEIIGLIKDYASETIGEADLAEEKTRLLSAIQLVRPDLLGDGVLFADNITEIARAVKDSLHEGVSLDGLDSRIEIVLGEARSGARTEAKFNGVDRIVEKMKNHKIGQFVNETTAASAVAIALSVGQTLTRGVASRVLSWVTFGGSALVGAGFAGIRENQRLKEERSQHARERATGKEIKPGSERREQMEKFQYDSRSASEMAATLEELLIGFESGAIDQATLEIAIAELANVEARNKLSDEQKIDLIKFSSTIDVERERLQLDIARAEMKAFIRGQLTASPELSLPEGADFDSYLDRLISAQITELTEGDEGIKDKDRLFDKMRHKQVAKAALKGLASGLIVGEVVHEIRGAITGEMTPGQWVLAYINDRLPHSDMSQAHEEIINAAGATIKLPENIQLEHNQNGTFNFIDSHTGNRVVEHVSFNDDGTLTDESKADLTHLGVRTTENTTHVSEVVHSEKTVEAKDWVESQKAGTTPIHRKLWFDNDTPGKYDLNELKLWWGGQGGVDSQGNYVFNVSHMTEDGSFHNGFSTNTRELVEQGKMKMLLSVSRDTQRMVFEVPIDDHGNAFIDKDSEIGKTLFELDGKGHAVFKGKFAEVAYSDGVAKDGGENVKILATHVGHGLKTATTTINETISHDTTQTLIDVPVHYDVLPPPVIPIIGRRPLEPLESGRKGRSPEAYYGYGAENIGLLDRKDYRSRMSEKLAKDSSYDVIANDKELVQDYLAKLNPDYLQELTELNGQINARMSETTRAVVAIPAYQEEKNILKTLEAYANQDNLESFELIILENHPNTKSRDRTGEIITKFQEDHPNLRLRHVYKTFKPEEAKIGNIRKFMTDLALTRKQEAGVGPLVVISNDADIESANSQYIQNTIEAFDNHPKIDAATGKWDYPKEAYEKMPLLHAAQRLWQFYDKVFASKFGTPGLIGRNSMVRSGALAAVGGYNPNAKIAEDLEIGWLIESAREYNRDCIGYLNTSSLVSNPRRAVLKMLGDSRLVDQYADFHENAYVRENSWETVLAEKIAKTGNTEVDFDINELTTEVNSIYSFYHKLTSDNEGGWLPPEHFDYIFARAMGFLGAKYHVDNDGKVVIDDVSKLETGLGKKIM
ncbi:MAG: glycosyltransferase [bacterium]|nr:glycosyltransferase [bacterium]